MDREGLAVVPEAAPTGAGSRPAPRSFRALRSRPFRLYFVGQVASASGTFLQQTAVGWLVLQLTGSAATLGLVLAAGGVPSLLLGPWGGAVADRFDLRRLIIATQAVSGVLAAVLWGLAVAGRLSVGVIVAAGVVGGFVQIVDSPARQALVGSLVPPDDLSSAISLNGVLMNTARVVGPAVAGLLIATVGTTPCFAVNAVSYLAVIVAMLAVRPLATARRVPGSAGGVRDGLRYAAGRQQLWLPLVMMSLVGLFAFNFAVVLPVFARVAFNGGGGTYGLMSTVLSVGSVVGSLAVGLVRHPRRTYLVAATVGFGISLAGTAVSPTVPVACIALVVTGATGFAFATLASTTLQLHSAPAYRGRIVALWVFVFLGTTPIGSLLTGGISSAAGPRAALAVGAAACLVAAGIGLRVRTPPRPDAALTDLARPPT